MKKYTAFGVSIIIFFSIFAVPLFSSVVMAAPGGEDSGVPDTGLVACEDPPNCEYKDLIKTIGNIVDFLVLLATSIATIIIAWAGFLYLTAAGNTSKISQAHNLIWMAVIGFLIALSASLIVDVILNSLGAEKIENENWN